MTIADLKNSVIQKLAEVAELVLNGVLELLKFERSSDVNKVNNL